MIPIYNKYLKPTIEEIYVSEISFINTTKSIIRYENFYVEFESSLNKKPGFFCDNNDYLKNIYFETIKDSNLDSRTLHLKYSNNIITNVQRRISYYSYVKIIKDYINPQLEGKIMIFNFGKRTSDKIYEYLNSETRFNNIFKLKIEIISGFPNYDHCYFTNKELSITDLDLDLNSEIFFKQINIKQIEREEKLKKLTSDIELRNDRYEEYLKLKEEFENE